jgi:hypothetical protein
VTSEAITAIVAVLAMAGLVFLIVRTGGRGGG